MVFEEEITDLNLSFLTLAREMAAYNINTASVKFGIPVEDLKLLLEIPPTRLLRVAQKAMLTPQFRITGNHLRSLSGETHRDEAAGMLHAIILSSNIKKKPLSDEK